MPLLERLEDFRARWRSEKLLVRRASERGSSADLASVAAQFTNHWLLEHRVIGLRARRKPVAANC